MAIDPGDLAERVDGGAETLLARASGADLRSERQLAAAIDDFFLAENARLDDAERARIAVMLDSLVGGLERDIAQHAARLLAARDQTALAEALAGSRPGVLLRLCEAGLVRDADLMRELIGRAREERLADRLPGAAPGEPDGAGLLGRLVDGEDSVAAAATLALMLAESRRRGSERADLPAELHHRLAWWTAGALRERLAPQASGDPRRLDAALTEAVQRALITYDESERVEAAALRLAAALDPAGARLPAMLIDALTDRRPSLAIALLARALGIDYPFAREMLLDPSGDQLWLALRALDFPREAIARMGLALSEGDPRRDLDAFAEAIDMIAEIAPEAARAVLAPLKLHPDYRAALLALARGVSR